MLDGVVEPPRLDGHEVDPLSASCVPSLASSQASIPSAVSSHRESPTDVEIPFMAKTETEETPIIIPADVEPGKEDTEYNHKKSSPSLSNWAVSRISHDNSIPRPGSNLSLHSMQGLKSRLPLKTDSYLGDVWSVFQNLTISGASTRSHMSRAGRAISTFSASIAAMGQDGGTLWEAGENDELTSPLRVVESRLPLPGDFAAHTLGKTYFIGQRRYRRRFDPLEDPPKMLKDSRTTKAVTKLVPSVSQYPTGNRHPDIQGEDPFGNSSLHIAAALGKPYNLLIKMIDELGADLQAENSAGETFLHLLDDFDIEPLDSLLDRLRIGRFDFNQRNCLGQTPLHQLMQEWMGKFRLKEILTALTSCKITLPTSRDSFGATIRSQLTQADIDESTIQNCLSQTGFRPRKKPLNRADMADLGRTAVVEVSDPTVLPNYGDQTSITTMEDLCLYDHHRALLRTIVKAYSAPRHEDSEGRNGLHCLAEVSLTLHIPFKTPNHAVEERLFKTRHEEYLQGLVHAGVDPDNHDNQGLIPLMAFIIHNRDGEDDDTTATLLSQLCDAGASVNRRSRMGETPLHLAVRFGKRSATNFLLEKGANIHARDISGNGIIALGMGQSKKTSDSALYAQIMLCINLVTKAGGVSAPSFYQEWALVGDTYKETKFRLRMALPRLPLRT